MPSVIKTAEKVLPDEHETPLPKQQLMYLLHANKCMRNDNAKYSIQYCHSMSDMIGHMATCDLGKGCLHKPCSTRDHPRIDRTQNCKRDCTICQLLISPVTGEVEVQKVITVIDMLPNVTKKSINRFFKRKYSLTEIEEQELKQFDILIDDLTAARGSFWRLARYNKNWRRTMSPKLRVHLLHRLVKMMFSMVRACNIVGVFSDTLTRVLMHARLHEASTFFSAISKSDYYHSLAEKFYVLVEDLRETVEAVNLLPHYQQINDVS